ncbi:MAG TPA: hypothetical protein VIF14_04045 [Alphaproteobacteria bacterium]|jgi:hypothetical protein
MLQVATSPADAVRPYPYVTGPSRRFKAAPTELSRLSASVMCASGVFSTGSRPQRLRSGPFFGAVVLLLTAATLALAGDPRPADRAARPPQTLLAMSDQLFSLGVGDDRGSDARAAAAPDALSAQDRFEIARMFRKSAAAR